MKLMEILKLINKESKDGLINVDDWRIQDAEHLIEMGFKITDDYHFATDRDPKIIVYKKTEVPNETKSKLSNTEYFYIEEEDRVPRRFEEFEDIIEYFAKYPQPELDKNR